MKILRALSLLGLLSSGFASAASIQLETVAAYVHADGALIAELGTASTEYFSTLGADNLGTFGWSFANTTGHDLLNLRLLGFLDADLDRDENTFFNEYAQFSSLSVPSTAPAGAIGPTSWEADEPGYLFGDIVTNLLAGALDNSNAVPSSNPDDVSLALGFELPRLEAGGFARVTFLLSSSEIGGLRQVDIDSGTQFWLNGYADSPSGAVPEPATTSLIAVGSAASWILRRFILKRKRSWPEAELFGEHLNQRL